MQCELKGCTNESFLIYYNHYVCEKHWIKHCEHPKFPEYLRKKYKIK